MFDSTNNNGNIYIYIHINIYVYSEYDISNNGQYMHTATIMGFNQQWWENNGNIKAIHIMGYMMI